MKLRSLAKSAAELLLARGGPAALLRNLRPSRATILGYHNVVPTGATVRGDSSLHLGQRAFAAQLDHLAGRYDVVPLQQILEAPSGGESKKRPRVALTFDDAYRGAVTVGVAELVKRGLPATIFVAPGFVGGGSFWWDHLSARGEMGDAVRNRAITDLAGRQDDIREWAASGELEWGDVEDHSRVAGEEELRAATAQPEISLGSHSWSHPNLAGLTDQTELTSELERPLRWLRECFPEDHIPWLAYPYGLYSALVTEAAANAGYKAGLAITGGGFDYRLPRDNFELARLNVPAGVSSNGFRMRAAGLIGA